MRKSPKLSPEVVERAVRMVFDAKDQYPAQWAAIESIAGKMIMFLKNLSMAGGFLLLAGMGAGHLSLDGRAGRP